MVSPGLSRDFPAASPPVPSGNLLLIKPFNPTSEMNLSIASPMIPTTSLDTIPDSNTDVASAKGLSLPHHDQYQPLSSVSATMTTPRHPVISSPHVGPESNKSFALSDDSIIAQFDIPRTAYIRRPGDHTIDISWSAYLEMHNYRSSFLPLRGTERDRYRSIIEEAEAQETEKRRVVVEALNMIYDAELEVGNMLQTRQHHTARGLSMVPPLIREQHIIDRLALGQGYDKLNFFKGHYKTRFGVLTACCIIPEGDWYLGHRPGDPIIRIKQHPINRGGVNQGDMFYVRDLAGPKDGDEIEIYQTRFEGIVPFNPRELYQRFTRYAFPAFVQMVIAAIGFDPRNRGHTAHGWAKAIEHVRTSEFEELSERDRAGILKLLRRIWQIKYGIDTKNYPGFLKSQVATSMSCFREMGWLMSRLQRDAPNVTHHHYWKYCKGLLQDITGRDATLLAQEYFDITLADEAEELLSDGDVENVLAYKQSKAHRDMVMVKLQDLYNTSGPGAEVSLQDINDLRNIATKYLSKSRYSEWLSRHPAKEISTATASTATTSTATTSTATTQQKPISKKRKRPEIDQDHDDLPAPAPALKNQAKQQNPPRQKRKYTATKRVREDKEQR
ncbi:hypothetical protein E0Z10_g2916 [Xylaria hypoxylon]|uniref:Uncharacterized protein n=1 Tax=Xylaria hypoxylon TaxID=37992 RepID=A0A4Z0Z4W6_9PEZI|nr:hypothetical protein E0Z10_g2916 [Xylaria hypoxylon]